MYSHNTSKGNFVLRQWWKERATRQGRRADSRRCSEGRVKKLGETPGTGLGSESLGTTGLLAP